jgi:hypothetical protein
LLRERAAALFVNLAELLHQYRDLRFDALQKLFVGSPARQLPVLHDLHFEFHTLVLRPHENFPNIFSNKTAEPGFGSEIKRLFRRLMPQRGSVGISSHMAFGMAPVV